MEDKLKLGSKLSCVADAVARGFKLSIPVRPDPLANPVFMLPKLPIGRLRFAGKDSFAGELAKSAANMD